MSTVAAILANDTKAVAAVHPLTQNETLDVLTVMVGGLCPLMSGIAGTRARCGNLCYLDMRYTQMPPRTESAFSDDQTFALVKNELETRRYWALYVQGHEPGTCIELVLRLGKLAQGLGLQFGIVTRGINLAKYALELAAIPNASLCVSMEALRDDVVTKSALAGIQVFQEAGANDRLMVDFVLDPDAVGAHQELVQFLYAHGIRYFAHTVPVAYREEQEVLGDVGVLQDAIHRFLPALPKDADYFVSNEVKQGNDIASIDLLGEIIEPVERLVRFNQWHGTITRGEGVTWSEHRLPTLAPDATMMFA